MITVMSSGRTFPSALCAMDGSWWWSDPMRRLQPLRRWLSLQFALVASIPLVVVAGLVWIFLLPQMRADIAVRHQALAGAIAGRVSAHLLGADHALRALADYINTQGPQLGQSWIPLLDAEAGTGDMFEAIYIADENRAVYAVGLPEMRRGNREDLIGLDLSRRDFIGDAPILKREVWSETFLSTVSSRLAVALAIPMGYRVMVGEITIERLSQFIRQLPVEQGLFTTIVDRQGRIIADSRPGFSGRQVDAGILGMVQDRSQAQGSPTTFEMDGRILMGTTVAVEQGGWKVLVAQPYADAFRTMTATLRMVATGLAISLLLAVTVGWLQARSLSRHIRRYTRQAQAIASGDYDQPWPESRTLEFSGLVRDLQLMSDAIRQREKAITAGRERYRTLFETMVQGVIYVDAEGRITTANPAAEMILGLGLEQVKGRSLLDLPWQVISEDGASLASDAMPVVVALRTGRAVRDVVIGLSNPDTRTVTWVSVNAIPLFQPGKELPFQVYATLADITERKRAEEALRLSEDNLRITLDSIGDAVIATDINGVITRLNPIAEHLTGWSAAEAIDRPLVEVFHVVNAYTRQRVESPVEKVLAEGQIVGLANHTVLIAKDGTEYQIADSGAPIRRADGEIVGVVLVFRDVTEAHAQAQKISESEYVLRGITTNLPGVVYQFRASADHQYSLQHYSEKANEIFGLDVPVEEFFAAIAARIPDGEKERFYASIQAAVEQEIPWDYEGRYIKPNGDTMWFQGNSIPHRKGDDILFDGILLDITERKLAENELRRLRNYLANIIDSMPSVLVGVDGEGRVTQWNRHAQVTTGMDAEAVLGKPLEAAYPLLSSKMDKIRETIRSGNVHREQKVQRHDFQEIRYEDVIIYPLITNGVEGAVIRVDDVTERV
ncbi:MAG TPA: hypothetical protein DEO88_01075, partial [Syntrophobacteraceae bacterium]|nr:hypothetical protein [Syntrophobacteraceae bacterium]